MPPTPSALLILIDGMRPDALMAADAPAMQRLMRDGASTARSRTVMPSSTLPCHTSLFYGVSPARHGITDNTWHPLARPVPSLFDVAYQAKRRTAMFYTWGELRDLCAPQSLHESHLIAMHDMHDDRSDQQNFDAAAHWIKNNPGFGLIFAYFGWTDVVGHHHGWMSPQYLDSIASADRAVARLVDAMPHEGLTILTADHGGHDKTHGTDAPEDMLVPLAFFGQPAHPGKDLGDTTILDIAPTIAAHLRLTAPPEWEGRPLPL